MTDRVVEIEAKGDVRVVWLNRPNQSNAINGPLHEALVDVWTDLRADGDARAVVLTGRGEAFSAGGDLDLLATLSREPHHRKRVLAQGRAIIRSMLTCPLPIIAAVNGPAIGLGASIVSLCDYVVIADDAHLRDAHVLVGVTAGDGAAYGYAFSAGLLRAKEQLLLARPLSPERAVEMGLANEVVKRADVLQRAMEVADEFARLPAFAVQSSKAVLNAPILEAVARHADDGFDSSWTSFGTLDVARNVAAMSARVQGRNDGTAPSPDGNVEVDTE